MMTNAFDELNELMLRRLMEINPDSATIFGMHEPFDRHLPDGSSQKIRNNLKLLSDWKTLAEEEAVRDELSADQKVSLEVLRFTLENYRFVVDDYPLWKMRPEALELPGSAMLMMMIREYAPIQTRLRAISERLSEMPRYLDQFRGRFEGVRTVRTWTEAALATCNGFPSFLEYAEKLVHAHAAADVRNEMARNVEEAKEELKKHAVWLGKMIDSSTDKFAMGRDTYTKLLRIRRIPFSPEGLLDIAAKYLEDYKRQRELVGRRIAVDGTVDEARRTIESECPRSIDEVVERTREAVVQAKEFVLKHNMVSMPIDSSVHVIRTPEFLAGSTPSAATYLPAVFERSQETIFLISGGNDSEAIGSVYNYYAIDNTAVHEAYPGHHHQGVMSNRKPWMHQLPHIVCTPETASPPYESQEGWATYCEQIMAERGFSGSDKHLLATLDYCIWTACRVFNEVKLSCGEATLAEMIDFAVAESGYSRDYAEADVKGFTLMPGYGMCYLAGRHLVSSLKRDLQANLGAKFSERQFHDLVAENGNLPFYLLEAEVRVGMNRSSSI